MEEDNDAFDSYFHGKEKNKASLPHTVSFISSANSNNEQENALEYQVFFNESNILTDEAPAVKFNHTRNK